MTTPTIERFTLGPFQTNCYLVHHEGGAWLFDAPFEIAEVIDRVRTLGTQMRAVYLTHAHCDHVGGLADVLRAFPGTPVFIHELEREWPADPNLNLSAFTGMPTSMPTPDRTLVPAESVPAGGLDWTVLFVPGHSPGSCAFYNESIATVIGGDALFAGSIGRTDFPGSDAEELERSIRQKLYTLPAKTRVLPGHGPPTTIGQERLTNPYVRG